VTSAVIALLSRHIPAVLLISAISIATPLAAQDVGSGRISTKPLEPVEGAEPDAEDGNRFKRAPFKAPEIPSQPILIQPVDTALRPGAQMRQLDKMTGRTQTFEIAAGTEQMVDRLRIRLEACRAPEDNAQHGTMAFVQIWDTKREDEAPAFSGWMFAESPALSAMDHPRYDLWVISCTTASGEAPTASE
jgi:hypothetical protein